jgi:catechol 2,3-dioxygenase
MEPQTSTTSQAVLPASTHIGLAALTVADLGRSVKFYEQLLGFHQLGISEQMAVLGTREGNALLALIQQNGASPQPAFSTGLYHIAILFPSRLELARALARLVKARYRIDGASDHLVSEALYLSDPDGNGLELYRDRPRDQWPRLPGGKVAMASDPLDVQKLLDEGFQDPGEEQTAPNGTVIGHMHLRVDDMFKTAEFYHTLLGFDVIAEMPGALFVSAGGYHHHIGLNTWQSRGASPPPKESVGLRFFSVQLPDQAAINEVRQRVQAANIPVEQHGEDFAVRDPAGSTLLFTSNDITAAQMLNQEDLSELI